MRTQSGDGGDNLAKLEAVKYRGLTGSIKADLEEASGRDEGEEPGVKN